MLRMAIQFSTDAMTQTRVVDAALEAIQPAGRSAINLTGLTEATANLEIGNDD